PLQHQPQRVRVGDVVVVVEVGRGSHPVDVGAGAEAWPVAPEHDRACTADVDERLRQLGDERCVEGVAHVRSRHRHVQEAAVPFDPQRAHALHRKLAGMLRGALAAALTPLREGGSVLDEAAIGPYLDFLAASGLDGLLVLGTTGEGILLTVAERRRVAEHYLEGSLPVIVHAGAQTTADTVALAAHAAVSGAAGVAVIGPPYFQLDEAALLAHLAEAARACAPLPFYVYE